MVSTQLIFIFSDFNRFAFSTVGRKSGWGEDLGAGKTTFFPTFLRAEIFALPIGTQGESPGSPITNHFPFSATFCAPGSVPSS